MVEITSIVSLLALALQALKPNFVNILRLGPWAPERESLWQCLRLPLLGLSEAQWLCASWRHPCTLSQMCSSCLSQLGWVSAICDENTSTNTGLHGIFRKLVNQHAQDTCSNSISATGIDKLAPSINTSSLHKGLDEGCQQLSVTFYFSASMANYSYPDGLVHHQI